MAQYIFLNGSQFNPSSVEYEDDRFGESRRMADGTMRYYHVAFKGKWTITWTKVRETYLAAIRTIGRLTTSFTFTDHSGVAHTVIITPGGFKVNLSAEGVDSAGVKRYDITLVVDEV